MASTNFNAISGLLLVLAITLWFHPLEAAYQGCPEKTMWPELVGVPGCEAAAQIIKENPSLYPIVIPYNTAVPYNYICNRVFIPIAGPRGLVSNVPRAA